jgi:uncharacterized lipoprotein
MSRSQAVLRGAGRLAIVMPMAVLLLTGCSWFRHHNAAQSCSEPKVTTNIGSLPPLRVPEGLDPPDTHNGVHIPALAGTEHVRGKNEPCLSLPPPYGNPVATPGMLQPPPGPAGAQPGSAAPGRTGQRPGRDRQPPN